MGENNNSGVGIFIVFFIFIIFLAIFGRGPDGESRSIFSIDNTVSSTAVGTSTENVDVFVDEPAIPTTENAPQETEPEQLTPQEIERRLARAFAELEKLEDKAREAKIWGARSPFENLISIRRGNVRTEDPEKEYLILEARRQNESPVDISGWLLESYVTEEGETIPFGSKVFKRGRKNSTSAILLDPGERAYVVTGESPIGAVFHENMCTGYLAQDNDFTPSLTRSCPDPEKEMEDFEKVLLDDDSCFDFVERIRSCVSPDDDIVADANLSRRCELFIDTYLNYNDCVDNHKNEPFFDKGEWYIYLERDEDELWRTKREIIRLQDRQGRTVDVLEY